MSTKTLALSLAMICGYCLNAGAQHGLLGEYFNGQNFEQKITTRTDAQINFVWDNVAPISGMDPHVFSIRWTGKIQTPETGVYRFNSHVDDGIRVRVDGKLVIDAWALHDSEPFSGQISLEAGHQYHFQVEYFNAINEGEIQLYWQLPSEEPTFRGLLGYNYHLIDSKYLSPPPQPVASAPPPPTKPVVKPVTPVQKPVAKPTVIAKDTLEKYLPKNVFFVKSKSIMLPESEPELDRLAGFLVRNPKYRLTIEGHTDRIGNSAKNLVLSQERAQTVAAYLTQKGVAATRITAKGYGDTRPLVHEADGIPNAKNRRVEFVVD